MTNLTRRILFVAVIAAVVLLGAVYAFKNTGTPKEVTAEGSGGDLVLEESSYDFGTISMVNGNVEKSFVIRNGGTEPLEIKKMYTSCMCTTAFYEAEGQKALGPFGMPGHGFVPPVGKTLAPGASATVRIVFDPAAHGPSGVGRISRVVTIDTNGGSSDLSFSAMVTP